MITGIGKQSGMHIYGDAFLAVTSRCLQGFRQLFRRRSKVDERTVDWQAYSTKKLPVLLIKHTRYDNWRYTRVTSTTPHIYINIAAAALL